jgi:FkbM family methyltransferase
MQPVKITEHNWHSGAKPVVTIVCITYNHLKFISDAIEGFLIQETTFPVEIIIHDDASNDGTAEIVREYQKKHPQILHVVHQEENQYALGRLSRAFFSLLFMAKGKYIAYCEGDDFWTDPRKLELQVEFLEKNPEYVASFHDTRDVDASGKMFCDMGLPKSIATDSTQDDLLKTKRVIPIRALMHRHVLDTYPIEMDHVKNGDNFLWILLGEHGACKFLQNIKPSCYRVHGAGIWQSMDSQMVDLEIMNTYFWSMKFFQRKCQKNLSDYYRRMLLKKAWSLGSFSNFTSVIFARWSGNLRNYLLASYTEISKIVKKTTILLLLYRKKIRMIREIRVKAAQILSKLQGRVAPPSLDQFNSSHAKTDPFFNCLSSLGYSPEHVVDIGANRGNWTRTAIRYFPESRYTLFEPQSDLLIGGDLEGDSRVQIYAMGVGPKTATMLLSKHDRDDSYSFALTKDEAASMGRQQVEAPVVALDEFLTKEGLPYPSMLKIDAEGWDLEVLKGAEAALLHADVVLLEASVMNKSFPNKLARVIAEMELRGFVVFDITDLNRTVKQNALWLVEIAFVKAGGFLDKKVDAF